MISSVRFVVLSVSPEANSPTTGILSMIGMPDRLLSWLSLISPARSTVWPLATATELRTLRVETVGVSVLDPDDPELLAGPTGLLISCSMSRRTFPLAKMRGRTRRMMPVIL